MLVATIAAVVHPVAVAWGEDSAPPIHASPDAGDRVAARTPDEVEMLRRLLEMTVRAQAAAVATPSGPARGTEAAAQRDSAAGT